VPRRYASRLTVSASSASGSTRWCSAVATEYPATSAVWARVIAVAQRHHGGAALGLAGGEVGLRRGDGPLAPVEHRQRQGDLGAPARRHRCR
jgi:hypothetical protein